MKTLNIIIITMAMALAACSDEDEHSHQHADGGTNINTEGCAHLKNGPFVDVTGGADIKSAGKVGEDHKAYRVTIPAGAAGYVSFAAGDKGDHLLFLDAPVMFEGLDDQGQTVQPEKRAPYSNTCSCTCRPRKAGSSEGWMLMMRSRQCWLKVSVRSRMNPARQTSSVPASVRTSVMATSKASRPS